MERINEKYYPTDKEEIDVSGFINRYMKYIIMEGTVQAVEFNFRKRLVDIVKNPSKGFDLG